MKDIILEAEGLCKSYAHNGTQNHVLDQLSLQIYDQDFTVIMGPSGSGKSTLLYSLSGMDFVNAGAIHYQGKNIAAMKEAQLGCLRRDSFGFIFQQMHLVSNLSIYENIVISGYLNKRIKTKDAEERAAELIKRMGLEKLSTHLPSQCSGGEQQRAAIARAVIGQPDLLFADEPTGALNRKNTMEVLDLLTNLNQEGQGILMVTHDQRAALRADRILYLEDGKITGELSLSKYEKDEEKSREVQVSAWLSSLEW